MTQQERFRILDHTNEEIERWLAEAGLEKFRARQIHRWIYQEGVLDPLRMTDLPAPLRARLETDAQLSLLEPIRDQRSSDGSTRKVLFQVRRVADGWARRPGADGDVPTLPAPARTGAQQARLALRDSLREVESVLMRYDPTDTKRARRTVCVSTQVGCAVGCPFCATGKAGLAGNLTAGEIVEQVLFFSRLVRETEGPDARITNVVFMGMGEPFHNYQAVIGAIHRLNDSSGLNVGARHITVSTSGLVPQIRQLALEPLQVGLAVSLHAASDAKRDLLVPVNRRYTIADLMDALRYYLDVTNRQVTFEWALMAGINDSDEDARELAALCAGLNVHVNIIPMNPVPDAPFHRPPYQRTRAFQRLLTSLGVSNTLRVERGVDIAAACGQLRAQSAAAQSPSAPSPVLAGNSPSRA